MNHNKHANRGMLAGFLKYFLEISGHLVSVYLVLLACVLAGAVIIAATEGMSFADALYFSLITGLTVGYGDIVAQTALGKAVSVALGLIGILLTGLVVAVLVEAVRRARQDVERSA